MEPRYSENNAVRIVHAVLIALLLKLSLAASFGAATAIFGKDTDLMAGGEASFVAFLLLAALQIAIVIFGINRFGRVSLSELGWFRPKSWAREIVFGIGGLFFVIAGMIALLMIFGVFDPNEVLAGFTEQTPAQRALFLGFGVIAAFAEETVFRGYMQPTAIHKLGQVGGIFFTAILFSCLHLKAQPIALLTQLWIGLVLSGLRWRNENLWSPAITHALIWVVLGLY